MEKYFYIYYINYFEQFETINEEELRDLLKSLNYM